ncbi:hypothetical protein SKB0087_02840 [Anaerococcus nagyae]
MNYPSRPNEVSGEISVALSFILLLTIRNTIDFSIPLRYHFVAIEMDWGINHELPSRPNEVSGEISIGYKFQNLLTIRNKEVSPFQLKWED